MRETCTSSVLNQEKRKTLCCLETQALAGEQNYSQGRDTVTDELHLDAVGIGASFEQDLNCLISSSCDAFMERKVSRLESWWLRGSTGLEGAANEEREVVSCCIAEERLTPEVGLDQEIRTGGSEELQSECL